MQIQLYLEVAATWLIAPIAVRFRYASASALSTRFIYDLLLLFIGNVLGTQKRRCRRGKSASHPHLTDFAAIRSRCRYRCRDSHKCGFGYTDAGDCGDFGPSDFVYNWSTSVLAAAAADRWPLTCSWVCNYNFMRVQAELAVETFIFIILYNFWHQLSLPKMFLLKYKSSS